MNVERRPSTIHGNGVFAIEYIRKGRWQYIYGELITLQPHPMAHFCFVADGDLMFLPYAPFCWLNHQKRPNCAVYEDENGVYYIEALRGIKVDEELTIDYGYEL